MPINKQEIRITSRGERKAARKRRTVGIIIAAVIVALLAGIVAIGIALFKDSSNTTAAVGQANWFSSKQKVDGIDTPQFDIKDDQNKSVPYHISSAAKWTATPKELNCPDNKAVFFAYQGTGNAFGPDQREKINTAEDVVKRLHEKACDPLFTKGTDMFFKSGDSIDGPTIESETLKMKDKKVYQETVQSVSDQIDMIYVADLNVAYESAGMIPGSDPSVMPTITKWGDRPILGKTAVIVLKNGEYRLLRIECDLQWSVLRFVRISAPVQAYAPRGGPPPPVTKTTTQRPPPPPPVCHECCNGCPPPPPPPPVCTTCDCLHNCPPPPPTCPDGSPLPPNGLCEKEPTTAPGNGGPGTGGSTEYGGGGRPDTPKPETTWTPRPDTYTPPSSPVETTAPPAPQTTVTPTPSSAQPTVAPSSQPEATQEITGCTPEIC